MPTINYAASSFGLGSGDWLPYALAVYTLVWFVILALAVCRSDLDPVTRLMWVVVVIFVPLGGVLLYAVLAPPRGVSPVDARAMFQVLPGSNHPVTELEIRRLVPPLFS